MCRALKEAIPLTHQDNPQVISLVKMLTKFCSFNDIALWSNTAFRLIHTYTHRTSQAKQHIRIHSFYSICLQIIYVSEERYLVSSTKSIYIYVSDTEYII